MKIKKTLVAPVDLIPCCYVGRGKSATSNGGEYKEGKYLYQLLYVEKPDQFLYAVYAGGADGGNEC